MDRNVPFPFTHKAHPTTISQCHLALTCQTAENSNDMFWGFVCLINNDYSSVMDGTEKRGVSVFDDTSFQGRCEH
jgi:hypothetical protein